MRSLDRTLRLSSLAAVATFFGTMLTEAFVLVPFWQSVDPAAFLSWYVANGDRLLAFFGPVTAIAGLSALASAASSWRAQAPGRAWVAAAAAVFVVIALMFPAYFEAANTSFADGSLPPAAVPAALATWSAWHQARTALAGLCLALCLRAAHEPRAQR